VDACCRIAVATANKGRPGMKSKYCPEARASSTFLISSHSSSPMHSRIHSGVGSWKASLLAERERKPASKAVFDEEKAIVDEQWEEKVDEDLTSFIESCWTVAAFIQRFQLNFLELVNGNVLICRTSNWKRREKSLGTKES
jgi:hypothetical protein